MTSSNSHVVVFWVGGKESGEWRTTVAMSEERARQARDEIRRGGRHAMVEDARMHKIVGPPEGPPRS